MTTYRSAPLTGEVKQGAHQTVDNVYCTSTAAQRKRLMDYLIHNGAVNTMYARDRLNIMAPAPRIKELRDQGHVIHTARLTINDRDGRSHPRVALYTLLELAEVVQ